MANEPIKPTPPKTPDPGKKPDIDIQPLTDDAVKDVAGGLCSLEACSSGGHCVADA